MLADLTSLAVALLENMMSEVITLIDFAVKCAILVMCIKYTERSLFPYIDNLHKHKLWMTAIILLGFLPASSLLSLAALEELGSTSNLTFITFLVPSTLASSATQSLDTAGRWIEPFAMVYVAGLVFFLAQLVISFFRIATIKHSAVYTAPPQALAVLQRLRETLDITRDVQLGFSTDAFTPMTFGYRRPVVILPSEFDVSDTPLLENVLTHELAHIKRHDWAIYIGSYLIVSINWFNPFIWRALRNLRLEAEFACDNAVIQRGANREEFASQLVGVARQSLCTSEREILARAAIHTNDLTLRVQHILNRYNHALPGRRIFSGLSLVAIPVLFALVSVGKVIAIEDETNFASESLRLIRSEIPVYPDIAFSRGIQGYTQYSFTVDANGDIDPTSIRLEKGDASHLFNQASLQALSHFKFKPRKINGKPSATAGVTYSFNYVIQI